MLKVESVPLDLLRSHPKNPRRGDIGAIIESLEANGQYQPIVTANEGTVLVGNHRFLAMKQLGWEEAQVVRLEVDPDSEQATKVMLADNRTSDRAEYDTSLLVDLLATLDETSDLTGTGYAADDLETLRALDTPLDSADMLPPDDDRYVEQYGVIVLCSDEEHQRLVFDRLTNDGFKVRVVTT